MRLLPPTALLVLAFLAACDSSTPPRQPAADAAPTATPAIPAKAPVAVKVPVGAQPLIGTWAADIANCGNAGSVVTITATSYKSSARSCDITLAANKDGSFSTTCGSDRLTLTPVFAPSGEGINIVVGEGKRQTVLRCSR